MTDQVNDAAPANAADQVNGRAVAALVFGILGIAGILPIISPIIAISVGFKLRNNGFALTGVILGWIGLALGIPVIIATFSVFGTGGASDLIAVPATLVQPAPEPR